MPVNDQLNNIDYIEDLELNNWEDADITETPEISGQDKESLDPSPVIPIERPFDLGLLDRDPSPPSTQAEQKNNKCIIFLEKEFAIVQANLERKKSAESVLEKELIVIQADLKISKETKVKLAKRREHHVKRMADKINRIMVDLGGSPGYNINRAVTLANRIYIQKLESPRHAVELYLETAQLSVIFEANEVKDSEQAQHGH